MVSACPTGQKVNIGKIEYLCRHGPRWLMEGAHGAEGPLGGQGSRGPWEPITAVRSTGTVPAAPSGSLAPDPRLDVLALQAPSALPRPGASNLTLDTGSGATINACEVGSPTPGNATTNCVSGSSQIVGDPTDLQLSLYGGGNIEVGKSLNSINAILWAPLATLDTHGQAVNVTWTGSMVLGQLTTDGQPVTLQLNYDERVATEFQDTLWDVTSYLQTSPTFSIPNF